MSLLNDHTSAVTLNFSLPAAFQIPLDGDNETIVTIEGVNPKLSTPIKEQRFARLFEGDWKFEFLHPYTDIGVKYRITVRMFHKHQPLLLDQEYFVIVNKLPHRQTVHLSPIGLLYVEVQEPENFPTEEAVTISLHEADSPEVELVRVSHDEQTATSFYLKYDPASVTPGKSYALSGIENRYHQRIPVSPGRIELSPPPREQRSWLIQAMAQWLEKPLRLFTDADSKIR
ncbi:hypothetical protein PseAD21_10435 [Pseudomonas sp. AD21]|uniref:hypothetical protein n=1 Tax=Pseudomonas sp. AD21 TaxID=396378 RepID=UPI000C853123|nr:hypothetical protein [Pseudomonas sp. AD21]PMQ11825.1 hypothetical protein PseAD21_10435 [Pseudomonas sp. AD21]